MSAEFAPRLASPRLGEAPLVHPSAEVVGGSLGRFTEIAERCVVLETTLGDYSYLMQDAQTGANNCSRHVSVRQMHKRLCRNNREEQQSSQPNNDRKRNQGTQKRFHR